MAGKTSVAGRLSPSTPLNPQAGAGLPFRAGLMPAGWCKINPADQLAQKFYIAIGSGISGYAVARPCFELGWVGT